MEKIDCRSLSYTALEQQLTTLGQPSFRTGQVFSWLHEHPVSSFAEMTTLPKALRAQLEERFYITTLRVQKKQVSQDGTVKYLFTLPDGNAIESVVMRYRHGSSLCISTQVGCRMGCVFCASTLGGLVRNLSAAELLGQVYQVEALEGVSLSNIVLMGIGEPLDNLEQVLLFLRLLAHPKGRNISLRSITLSTCGVVNKIYELAEQALPITLSVSLHAVTDEKRTRIMPINARWNIQALLRAATAYFMRTGRRVTYEYALLSGENDSPAEAHALADLLRGQATHVNLIPLNPAVATAFAPSSLAAAQAFQKILERRGVPTTIRRELGTDISAACGQLRHENQH